MGSLGYSRERGRPGGGSGESDTRASHHGGEVLPSSDGEVGRVSEGGTGGGEHDSDTSDSACSCESCDAYRERKDRLRPAMAEYKRIERDDSGEEAWENGWLTERFGKYGIIDLAADTQSKLAEYQAWLAEIKGVMWESLSNYDGRRLWSEFVERYNTATMPSKRYYELGNAPKPVQLAATDHIILADEKVRRQELKQAREQEQKMEVKRALEQMKQDRVIAEEMQKQRDLKTKLRFLFNTGDVDEARELAATLRPTNNPPPPPDDLESI
ncbi:hypothetical protein GNI_006880 [Gregarina niphandrodes]|uniref:Uncharacterized protein n=1 Tax=Gregarina niphandrodes TaxID=110365 RepID=A0A023BDG6_GRENI|nr:hypothetical protein GNI_006880 [Gregarina niphandrodes]EZG87450.1 hypothetical protein GNI_006880 [Gregarina niphandrodes]|eukprot:XP_011128655.1 hypothetical protein GNI_006880 [Gregarina niphandrodes]